MLSRMAFTMLSMAAASVRAVSYRVSRSRPLALAKQMFSLNSSTISVSLVGSFVSSAPENFVKYWRMIGPVVSSVWILPSSLYT